MCEVNSPSSIEEEEVVQPEPDRGWKRTRRAIPKRANTDFEFGWSTVTPRPRMPAVRPEYYYATIFKNLLKKQAALSMLPKAKESILCL
jgi:hypothetical protein